MPDNEKTNKVPLVDWGRPETWPTGWQNSIPKSFGKIIPANRVAESNQFGVTSLFTSTPITGSGTFARQFENWQYENMRWQYAMSLNAQKQYLAGLQPTKVVPELQIFTDAGNVMSGIYKTLTPYAERSPSQDNKIKGTIYAEPVTDPVMVASNLKKATYMAKFYGAIEAMVNAGLVKSVDDYIAISGINPADSYLSDADVAGLDSAISQLLSSAGVSGTAEQQIADYLTATPTVIKMTPIPMHRIAVDEIIKSLSTGAPTAELPEGMTAEDVLSIASGMGVPDDYQKELANFKNSLGPYFDAIKEQNASIDAAIAGQQQWKVPKLDFWQQLQFAVSSPMQAVSDAMRPYIEHVSNPMSGLILYVGEKMVMGTQGVESAYSKLRSQGKNPWDALGEAYDDYRISSNSALNFMGKMVISAATDPLTYIPGWGLSIPAKGLKMVGFKTFGAELISVNNTLWHVTNLPFDALKTKLASIPVSTTIAMEKENKNLFVSLVTGATKYYGKVFDEVKPKEFVDFLKASKAAFEKSPQATGDLLIDTGRYLATHTTVQPDTIIRLADKLGIKPTVFEIDGVRVVSDELLESVNDIISSAAWRTQSIDKATVAIMKEFGIPITKANLNRTSAVILDLMDSSSRRIAAIEKMSTAEGIAGTRSLLNAVVSQQAMIGEAYIDSMYALTKERQGIMQAVVNGIDQLDRAKWRRTLDRLYNTPFAMAYIARPDVLIGNVIEPMASQMLEGIRPGLGTASKFLAASRGLTVDPSLLKSAIEKAAKSGEPAGMFGGSYARSILPGALPTTIGGKNLPDWIAGKTWPMWFGQKMLDAQNTVGTATRWHAVTELYIKELAEILGEKKGILGGFDVKKYFSQAINGGSPKLPDSIGLKSEAIEKDTLLRFLSDVSNPEKIAAELKTAYSPTNILGENIRRIVKGQSSLSIGAKVKADELVSEGHILDSIDSINDFTKKLNDLSVSDLKQSDWSAAERFGEFVNRVTETPVENSQQFANRLANYDAMMRLESNMAGKLVKYIADDADKAFMAKKFGVAGKIWRDGLNDARNVRGRIRGDMERFNYYLNSNMSVLSPSQRAAASNLLNDLNEQMANADRFFDTHWNDVESVWRRIRETHPSAEDKDMIWQEYRLRDIARRQEFANSDAVFGSKSYLSQIDAAKVIQDLPEPILPSAIDVTNSPLSPADVAKMLGVEVDSLYRSITEAMVMQDKPHFVQLIKQVAESRPNQFRGFTEQKLGEVYDQIVESIGVLPNEEAAMAEIRIGADNVQKQLVSLRLNQSSVFKTQSEFATYFDSVAKQMKELFGTGKEVKAGPQITIATNPKVAGLTDIDAMIGKTKAGTLTYSEPGEYLMIETIKVGDDFKQQGVGERLVKDMINRSESLGKRLLSGPVVDEGVPFGDALIKKGVITVSKPPGRFEVLGSIISRGPNFEPKITKAALVPKVSKQSWDTIRQEAMDNAHRTYYKMFADYNNQTIFGRLGRMVFPYWKYESFRWNWLARTATRHPGTITAWDRYYEESEQGRIGLGADLMLNITAGTVIGPLIGLARRDYSSYYENLGPIAEVMDTAQRFALFPNPAIMTIAYMSPVFTGNWPELGSMLPGLHKAGLNALIASKIPGVSTAAESLQQTIFHDNFRDYYKSMIVNEIQLNSGGTLANGITGPELWEKIKQKVALTPEEKSLWDSAEQNTALISILRSQFAFLSYSPDQVRKIRDDVDKIYESYGFTANQLKYMQEHNIRPSDVMGGQPLAIRQILDQMWQWKYVGGTGEILAPASTQDLMMKVGQYWDEVELRSNQRIANELDLESRFLNPSSTTKPLTPADFASAYRDNWATYNKSIDTLNTLDERFNDSDFQLLVDTGNPQSQIELAKKTGGWAPPVQSPMDTLISLWYGITLEDRVNKYTGETEPDYLMYTLKRQAILDAMPPDIEQEFLDWVHKNSTPLELKRDEIVNKYFRGYQAISRIVFDSYDPESKALIERYYSSGVTAQEKDAIEQEIDPNTGDKLISSYKSSISDARAKLREASPELDFWLYVFGYGTEPKTAAAKTMIYNWERNRSSILGR